MKNIEQNSVIRKSNVILALVAVLLIVVGYFLMSGSPSGVEFNPDIFSFRRIVLAPGVSLAGYLLMFIAIMKK